MKFSAFIEDNADQIVDEWRSFALLRIPSAKGMSRLALEDHVREMLAAIVKDMRTEQSEDQRHAKSRGDAPVVSAAPETAAYTHGVTRQLAGFDVVQLVSEFRALRASVLSLWREEAAIQGEAVDVEEIVRFDEGIDQALAESIESYSAVVERSRDMFLAVLGHDVRGPLNSISMATSILELPALEDTARRQVALRVRRAADVIGRLTTDLLEYARSRLGSSLPIQPSTCDLLEICESAIEVLKGAHPAQDVRTEFCSSLQIQCDAARIQQAIGNLLNNAVQHGDSSRPITVTAREESDEAVLTVENYGQSIPRETHDRIFEPLYQLPPERGPSFEARSHVGLGLFIVKSIVEGHGGTVSVESTHERTVFTVRLPDAAPRVA